ncbi:MAG: response regulator [Planctomycetes bacterium]|nr:response regulator [Planctomycetota bacterium]
MSELLWLLAGAAIAVAVLRPWRQRAPREEPAPPPPPPPVAETITADARQLASTFADELANLLSGVEGRAHHLITTAPDRTQLPKAAEAMLASIGRLHILHTKVVAAAGRRRAEPGTTDLAAAVGALADALQQLQFGLELRWDPPPHLPAIAAGPTIVHDALLFLGAALLRAERGAALLSIDGETCFAGTSPWVQVEMALEWHSEPGPDAAAPIDDVAFTLDLEAARQLIVLHGGELQLHHLRSRSVRAVVRWPAVTTPASESTPALPTAAPAQSAATATARHHHHYGGALLLESDPSIRAMLSTELKATGRAVFACADGAAASSFLEATPDRFELLIVDDPQRLERSDPLAATIRTAAPRLKLLVLAATLPSTRAEWPLLHQLQKPFDVHELRHALATVLAFG